MQKAFDEIGKNKTVIMIAHRLSTVKAADKILFSRTAELYRKAHTLNCLRTIRRKTITKDVG